MSPCNPSGTVGQGEFDASLSLSGQEELFPPRLATSRLAQTVASQTKPRGCPPHLSILGKLAAVQLWLERKKGRVLSGIPGDPIGGELFRAVSSLKDGTGEADKSGLASPRSMEVRVDQSCRSCPSSGNTNLCQPVLLRFSQLPPLHYDSSSLLAGSQIALSCLRETAKKWGGWRGEGRGGYANVDSGELSGTAVL